jgi:threonine synthase
MRGERRVLSGRQRCEDALSLGEVTTPLVRLGRLEPEVGCLMVKDESALPSGSLEARGAGLTVTVARAFGLADLAVATTGNAGAALAAYAARAGLAARVFLPDDTPQTIVSETALRGGRVTRVDGTLGNCRRQLAEGKLRERWFDCSAFKAPYGLEGKKTLGLELAEQLGWRLPDVIFCAAGEGAALVALWKAFAELAAIGWIGEGRPRMVAVQTRGCAPIVKAYEAEREEAEAAPAVSGAVTGLRVPATIGDFLVLRVLRESRGFAIAVDDEAVLAARQRVAAAEGLLLSPEGAAAYAAYCEALADGRALPNEKALLVNGASGLKYPLPPIAGQGSA